MVGAPAPAGASSNGRCAAADDEVQPGADPPRNSRPGPAATSCEGWSVSVASEQGLLTLD
ncbi:hypothetical protein QTQ03_01840 [Micromonospora sp. WMMA1363]|uniref:hypothetical protein n=1 Tax=Micromonospora sp. WMMA1363 TaxID=3053985 RepID=UPI00259CC1F5|nr:hypothetical protein [Micromonospora sp. WMMA1363]MDM4718390.1 hypothetical protein [Micromonospora sp. WMMA1363]